MFEPRRHPPRSPLVAVIHQVRRRWRLKVALRGAAFVLALAALLLTASAVTLEAARFSPGWILGLRIVVPVLLGVAIAYLFARPLLRRVTDEQVALYLEEHEPSLQAAIISAVEATRTAAPVSPTSAALVARLVATAIEKCAAVEAGRHVERLPLRRFAGTIAAIATAALALFLFGPAYLRHGLSALLLVARNVQAAAPYRVHVAPGDATVPRGADQAVTARLEGFNASGASLMVRRAPGARFEPLPLVRGETGEYRGMLFDLAGATEYFVEAAGVRSPVFTITTVDVPYVRRIDLEYHFPAYTGLEPQKIEDGGDIAVLRGTEVRIRVVPTLPAADGRLVLHEKGSVPLEAAAEGSLAARFTVDRDGFYRIELAPPRGGQRVAASPQYTIDALADEAPSVSFSKPGRDTTASPVEEFFVEARAEDDFGVRGLDLVYSINGGGEKTIRLFDGRARLAEVIAGHTLFLEELNVQPGDSISYYARAADNAAPEQGGHRATSDMYFLRIRPFEKTFREATSQAGGAAGGAGGEVDALSQRQRQVIAATFNVQRDRSSLAPQKARESSVVVALAQARLREEVEGLVTRMNSQLIEPDPAFRKIAELLPKAVAEMKAAEARLQAIAPDAALPPEQRALGWLQKAEEEYELQVSVNRNAGAGGGAGSVAEDLAGLFGRELERMANQYETTARATEQTRDQRLDELMEKLKELSRRQEQELEGQRRRSLGDGGWSVGGAAQQRALAEQAEEAARRLERLSREENKPELAESARRLRDAAGAMRRAASGDRAAAGQAAAALERLRQTERELQRAQSARTGRDLDAALRQAEQLAREQRDIAETVRGLDAAGNRRREQVRQLGDRKAALESKVGDLEQHLDRSAAGARDRREASRRLSGAAGTIRDKRIRDKIRYSRALLGRGDASAVVKELETDISATLESVRKQLADAAVAFRGEKPDAMSDALERARRLARRAESLEQRFRERAAREAPRGAGAQQPGASTGPEAGQRPGEPAPAGRAHDAGAADGQGTPAGAAGRRDDAGGWGYGWNRLSPEDIRQFRGEIRQWSGEAQELRRLIREAKLDPKDIDEIVRALRALEDDRVYRDAAELARLQSFVTEQLKRFEYGLRRRAGGDAQEVVMSGAEEVPESFRKLVEQYYRSLATSAR